MTTQEIKQAGVQAVRDNYNCNGKYPCAERDYCIFCNGQNSSFDCNECGADNYHEGFLKAATWRINSVWHNDLKIREPKKPILVRFKNGLFHLCEDIRELKGIESEVEMFAYLEDLIPNTED